jgi:phosphoribosyl-AMP cyclohydrolase
MNRQQRMKLYDIQEKAYTEGTVEQINEQWIFFDEETEEAAMLDDYLHQEIEIFRMNRWKKGKLYESGKVRIGYEATMLCDHDLVRIRKHLIYSLERLLDGIIDDAFFQFVTTLNSLNFSIYDCIYCYNHLSFLTDEHRKDGVNFMVFDNQEQICNVQHHFCYFEKINDRFEFTLNTGKRLIIEKIIS